MAAIKRKSIAKLCLALGLFILAGVFRQLDRVAAPLPSAVCFLLTNLIYIGLAMSWGFSISRRILHRDDRRWLLLGCAMIVLWLFLRAVKYRFFSDDTVTRYLWYLYYVPQILAPLFSLYAALQLGRREGDAFSPRWYLLLVPAALLMGGVLANDWHQLAFRAAQAIGVTIARSGAFPQEGTENAQLVEAAAHECLTNLVRHAGGTRLEIIGERSADGWNVRYRNDGTAPSGPIIEGSGLAALRARTEAAGGGMTIAHAPRFELTLTLPQERQETL